MNLQFEKKSNRYRSMFTVFNRWVKTLIIAIVLFAVYFGFLFVVSLNSDKRVYAQHTKCQDYLEQQNDSWHYDGISDDFWYWSECDRSSIVSFINAKESDSVRHEKDMMNAGNLLGILIGLLALSYFLKWLIFGRVKE